jgi:hypothetical protein
MVSYTWRWRNATRHRHSHHLSPADRWQPNPAHLLGRSTEACLPNYLIVEAEDRESHSRCGGVCGTDAQGRSVPTYLMSLFLLSFEAVGTKIRARLLSAGRAFSDSATVALNAHEATCVHGLRPTNCVNLEGMTVELAEMHAIRKMVCKFL